MNKTAWSTWDQNLKKMLYDRLGEGIIHLFDDTQARDHFHDLYERGLTPLDALQHYTVNGIPRNDTMRLA